MSRSARSCPGPSQGHPHPTCVSCIKSSVAMLKKFLGCHKISPFIFLSNPGIVNTSFSFIKPMYVCTCMHYYSKNDLHALVLLRHLSRPTSGKGGYLLYLYTRVCVRRVKFKPKTIDSL